MSTPPHAGDEPPAPDDHGREPAAPQPRGPLPEGDPLVGPDGWVTLYRATRLKPCRERALVLAARSIPHRLVQRGGRHELEVPAPLAVSAAGELAAYERENVGWPPRFDLPPAAPGASASTAAYAALLLAFFLLQGGAAFGLDWVARGGASAAAIEGGQWWRAVTALFLHADVVHLGSNLLYGSLFGYLVAWALGGGLGWLVVLAAGVLGNLTNAWIQDPGHFSIGASTAVFGAVGAMAGAEWRRRRIFREPRLRRWAPIVIAFLLLSTMGLEAADPAERMPGRGRIDVLAHVTGLVWGIPLGYAAASHEQGLLRSARAQLALGALALALPLVAWGFALA